MIIMFTHTSTDKVAWSTDSEQSEGNLYRYEVNVHKHWYNGKRKYLILLNTNMITDAHFTKTYLFKQE